MGEDSEPTGAIWGQIYWTSLSFWTHNVHVFRAKSEKSYRRISLTLISSTISSVLLSRMLTMPSTHSSQLHSSALLPGQEPSAVQTSWASRKVKKMERPMRGQWRLRSAWQPAGWAAVGQRAADRTSAWWTRLSADVSFLAIVLAKISTKNCWFNIFPVSVHYHAGLGMRSFQKNARSCVILGSL